MCVSVSSICAFPCYSTALFAYYMVSVVLFSTLHILSTIDHNADAGYQDGAWSFDQDCSKGENNPAKLSKHQASGRTDFRGGRDKIGQAMHNSSVGYRAV